MTNTTTTTTRINHTVFELPPSFGSAKWMVLHASGKGDHEQEALDETSCRR